MKYSVVICAYNEEEHIYDCVNSIINQSFPNENYEIIVVDNSSEDSTFKTVESILFSDSIGDSNIRLIKIEHVGLSASRNTAIQLCRGEYIAFVDGDAKADKDWLLNMNVSVSSSSSNAKIFSGAIRNLNQYSFVSNFVFGAHSKAAIDSSPGSKLIGANMMFHRTVFDSVLFLDGMRRGDESSLLARYKLLSPDCEEVHVDNAIVYNDYPEKLTEWINILYTEGKMRALINMQVIQRPLHTICLDGFYRLSFVISFLFLFLYSFVDELSVIYLIIPILLVIARMFKSYRYLKYGIRNTLSSPYWPCFIFSPVIGVFFYFLRDLGVLNYHLTKPMVNPIIKESKSVILAEKVCRNN